MNRLRRRRLARVLLLSRLAMLGAYGLLVVVLGSLLIASPAEAVFTEFIVNGEFGTNASPSLSSWTTANTANARASTNTINTSGGNAGFLVGSTGYFTSSFAVLGDVRGRIGGPPRGGTSTLSQAFSLPAADGDRQVTSWNLTVSFRTAFDGKYDSEEDDGEPDRFWATLTGVTGNLFTQKSNDSPAFPDCGPSITCASTQKTLSFNTLYAGLLPGPYTLTFSLFEASGSDTNTAAGIDSVSALGAANLAPVPEPTTLLLWGTTAAGLGGLAWRRWRRSRPSE